ncbi:hypothetical protein ABB37_03700 [Leptomonas pyrrhocoris]|uniref:Uncharacterized protein n=1 Tax=Leptomonas pyrrhocoris TaxID=157538 RepID=A0A0M9G2Z0_LEPPY|nr:hypothetical protein ABB37_03700 [Leptomonas pyrrhocoris]KPA81295.1 hypothetical protein ABB37_03700 [Leptomonas pyrrhocoris]|eukprot:XP_015659734.1 hypothetical protein ABB37_03700 [Leptomonas pyrrhocoris]
MTLVDTHWALGAVLQLSHHQLRASVAPSLMSSTMTTSKATRVSSIPRIMQATDGARLLLLARRPSGLAGVELGYGSRVRWTSTDARGGADAKPSRKVRLLASYLQQRGFETIPAAPRLFAAPQAPLVLHANHFIGWKLSRGTPAFPLYAHTLAELKQLRGKEMMALQPQDCLVASTYSEWDNMREVLCEPGWDFFNASDDVVGRILRCGIEAPLVDGVEGVSRVELS